jgi:regulator of nucleoside diphosphate kinase
MENTITLSKPDYLRLRGLLSTQRGAALGDRERLLDLEDEMERAMIVEADTLPADVVAIDSTVILLDLESGAHDQYALVLPAKADASRGLISVIAPLGTAVLGARVGDVVEWPMPGGLRRMRIEAVGRVDLPTGEPAGDLAAALS